MKLAVIILLAVSFSNACLAHDGHNQHHAFYKSWENRKGEGCCNNRDCSPIPSNMVVDDNKNGFVIVKIEETWCPVLSGHYLRKGNAPDWTTAHVCVRPKPQIGPDVQGPCGRLLCFQPEPRT